MHGASSRNGKTVAVNTSTGDLLFCFAIHVHLFQTDQQRDYQYDNCITCIKATSSDSVAVSPFFHIGVNNHYLAALFNRPLAGSLAQLCAVARSVAKCRHFENLVHALVRKPANQGSRERVLSIRAYRRCGNDGVRWIVRCYSHLAREQPAEGRPSIK
jgi:hypothetical protein